MTGLERSIQLTNGYYENKDAIRVILEFMGVNFRGISAHGNILDSPELKQYLMDALCEYLVARGLQIYLEKINFGGGYARSMKPIEILYYWKFKNPVKETGMAFWPIGKKIRSGKNNAEAPVRIIFYLDIEYFNKNCPGEIIINQEGCFLKIEPAYQLIKRNLKYLGINHMSTKTGNGYNFVCEVPLPSIQEINSQETFWKIIRAGAHIERSVLDYILTPHYRKRDRVIPIYTEAAFRGAMRLSLFFMQSLIAKANAESNIRIKLSDIGIEGLSWDCTQLLRTIDTASLGMIGPYLKFLTMEKQVGKEIIENTPIPIRIIRSINEYEYFNNNVHEMVSAAFNYDWVNHLLSQQSGKIPDGTVGIGRLADLYYDSRLYKELHQRMDNEPARPPHQWPNADDNIYRRDSEILNMVRYPNPLLQQPGPLEYFINVLFDWGESPRQIAERLAAIYSDSRIHWGNFFFKNDPLLHAIGWTLIHLGWRYV